MKNFSRFRFVNGGRYVGGTPQQNLFEDLFNRDMPSDEDWSLYFDGEEEF